jgi:dihydrofolate reductase
VKKIIIAAVAENGVIGRSNGEMPWKSKEEFQHFRNTTLGFPIIMGRKTFDSLGKPLAGRLNIVLSTKNDYIIANDDVKVFTDFQSALDFCQSQNFEKVFIIGGGVIFELAIKIADEMIISIMKFSAEGDVFFPQISEKKWKLLSKEERSEFTIFRYVRREHESKQN